MFYDPYLLLPEGVAKPGWDKGDGGLGYDSTTGSYTSPFVMAGINAKVRLDRWMDAQSVTAGVDGLRGEGRGDVLGGGSRAVRGCAVPCAPSLKVVRRSNALYGNGYGEPFQYQEVTGMKGVKGG
jgi:hypothetical protein